MRKILISCFMMYAVISYAALNTTSKVHKYCEVKYESQATLKAKIVPKHKADLCIVLVDYCSQAEGKIYFDKYNGTEIYLSTDLVYCR